MTALTSATEESVTGSNIDPLLTDAIGHMDGAALHTDPRLRAQEANQCLGILSAIYEKLLCQAKRAHIYGNGVAYALQAFDAILLESTAELARWLGDSELLRARLQRGIDAAIEADSQIYAKLTAPVVQHRS